MIIKDKMAELRIIKSCPIPEDKCAFKFNHRCNLHKDVNQCDKCSSYRRKQRRHQQKQNRKRQERFDISCLFDEIKDDSISQGQINKVAAITKLLKVASELNGDWVPDWINMGQRKWFIIYSFGNLEVWDTGKNNVSPVYFRTKELALKAVEILGEETIKLIFG